MSVIFMRHHIQIFKRERERGENKYSEVQKFSYINIKFKHITLQHSQRRTLESSSLKNFEDPTSVHPHKQRKMQRLAHLTKH